MWPLHGRVSGQGAAESLHRFHQLPVTVTFASQFLLNILFVTGKSLTLILCFCVTCPLVSCSCPFPQVLYFFPFRSGSRSSKTFKPKKNIPEGSHQYELLKHAEATLGSGNLRMAVMLPEGEDLNEWVAVNSKSAILFW